ncbi:MAG: hypothetical protein ACRD0Z_14790 [Acidimicrobiales bacterium]
MFVAVAALASFATAGAASAQSSGCAYTNNCVTITTNVSSAPQGGSFVVSGTGWYPAGGHGPHAAAAASGTVSVKVCNIETVPETPVAGDYSFTVDVPATYPTGPCEITGTETAANNGATVTASTSIIITTTSTVPPVSTGEPWAGSLYWLLTVGLGVAGAMMLGLAWRRRRFGLGAS